MSRFLSAVRLWFRRMGRTQVVPIAFGAAPDASRPDIASAVAPLRVAADTPAETKAVPRRLNGAVLRMRRSAVLDAFDQLGFVVVPGQVWRYVGAEDDIALGLDRFFHAIGCDPERLRIRDAHELARAEAALELVADAQEAFERLSDEVRAKLGDRLSCGDYEAVAAAAKAVAVFDRIFRLRTCWTDVWRLGALDGFLESMEPAFHDPLGMDADETARAEAAADELTRLMLDFETSLLRRDELLSRLRAAWPKSWTDRREGLEAEDNSDRFKALALSLRDDRWASPLEIAERLSELDGLNVRLARLCNAAEGLSERRAPPPKVARAPELVIALDLFGLAGVRRPTRAEIDAAWKALVREHHPDRGPETERDERSRMTREANRSRDILRAAFPA